MISMERGLKRRNGCKGEKGEYGVVKDQPTRRDSWQAHQSILQTEMKSLILNKILEIQWK